jgi:AmmeMemoRadiSam system protein B
MRRVLSGLRPGIDLAPSPLAERPGLLMRDQFRYTEQVLIIPPFLIPALRYFDGQSTDLDLQAGLSRQAGEIIPMEVVNSLISALETRGFLDDETYRGLREARQAGFAAASVRTAAHAGGGYAEDRSRLQDELNGYLRDQAVAPLTSSTASPAAAVPLGIAAPHASPWAGWRSYASAYGRLAGLGPQLAGKTVVILGTSHYGQPERFGMTRKSFTTPLGELRPDLELIDWLDGRAGRSIIMEDYCHAIEHSIEFQCIFLQQALGHEFQILPILCGPFASSLLTGRPPEENDEVDRFIASLEELQDRAGARLLWVLGVDLAHIGPRYGDRAPVEAGHGQMLEVREQDLARLEYLCEGRTDEFLEAIVRDEDPLKWCGFSPLYTFMKALPEARGALLGYEHWQIDEQSVVSFGALEFNQG